MSRALSHLDILGEKKRGDLHGPSMKGKLYKKHFRGKSSILYSQEKATCMRLQSKQLIISHLKGDEFLPVQVGCNLVGLR